MVNYKKIKKFLIWKCKQNKKVGSQLPTATPSRMAEIQEVEPVPSILLPCSSCNRTFRPEALAKHAKVCEKTLMKKRKKFDSAKQRLQGTEILLTTPGKKKETPTKMTQSKWREKQADLARTLQAVRKKSEPTVKVKPSDYEQCPYCERYFGPKAFDRHTDWCKEQQIKIKNNTNVFNEARERLQYRAPLTSKVLTRDKYLPRSRDPSPMSVPKKMDESPKSKMSNPLDRTSSLRISGRSKTHVVRNPLTSPKLLNETKISSSSLSDNKFDTSASHEKTAPKIYPEATPKKKGFPHVVRHVIATVLPKRFTIEDADKYDPFASAEQQMLELFSPDQKNNNDDSNSDSAKSKTSPVSAFAIYTPVGSSAQTPESQENENNNDSDGTTSPLEKIDNRKNFSLSNLSLCSIISIDSVDYNRNMKKHEKTRSYSAIETKGKTRAKVNMQQMLYGKSSPDPLTPDSTELGNIEACEAELLVSMLEFEKMLNSSPIQNPSPFSKEKTQNEDKKLPIDSAYSSLTRATGEGDTLKSEGSRFCHECGAKYPVPMAKFCCNCGIRRISL